jgi:hypothetical protein
MSSSSSSPNDICPICINTFHREGTQKKCEEICENSDCESFCVKGSDLCKIHNKIRYPIMCLSCNKKCCRNCYTTYFLSETDDITRCIFADCKREFDLEFLLGEDDTGKQRFPKTFIWGDLKEHREKVLLDKIMAKMPTYQRAASAIHKIKDLNKEIFDFELQINTLKTKQHAIGNLIFEQRRIMNSTGTDKDSSGKPVIYITRGKCPSESCNGFIEDKWECGICKTKVCSHCMLIKTEDHECNEDDKESAKFIRETTKPCPACTSRIYRIEGCFAENTEILMYNTKLKMSQDISVGDTLIGDDGEKRTVLELVSGTDDMYEIIQNNGDNYTVNSKHTLVLSDDKNKLVEIMVDDYLKLDETKKSLLYGIKSSNGINYPSQPVEIDPYLLGLWLGDGTHSQPIMASNDIGKSSCEECKACKMKEQKICDHVKLEDSEVSGLRTNPFTDALNKYNLVKNKHIPTEFLMNSREVRLALLAGIIDTDGSVSNEGKRVCIIQTKPDLSEQIISLARSLGFTVNFNIYKQTKSIFGGEIKNYKDQYKINLSGKNLSEIPTLLPRKKCNNSSQYLFRSKIEIKYVGEEKFYGWKIDKNHLFLAKDHTILKNCSQMFCTSCHVFFDWNTNEILKKTAFIHNPHYTEFMQRNGLHNVVGGCRQINHNVFRNLPLLPDQIKYFSNLFRKTQHILDYSERYIDPIETKTRDASIRYINSEITREDLSVIIQKYNKASKKYELTDARRVTYSNMIVEILTKFYTDTVAKPANVEEYRVECRNMIDELTNITELSLVEIGKMFNSGTPEIAFNFYEY